MAKRTTPHGKRVQRRAFALIGEGKTEQVFLRYLVNTLFPQVQNNRLVHIKYASAGGGSPGNMIQFCEREQKMAYNRIILLMDGDKEFPVGFSVDNYLKTNLAIIISQPCIEGMLLDIATGKPGGSALSSKRAKSSLHNKISMSELYNSEAPKYKKLFSLENIRKAATFNKALAKLLEVLEYSLIKNGQS